MEEPPRPRLLGGIENKMEAYPDGLSSYLFNSGLAFEKTNQTTDSLVFYLKAIRLDGGFEPAAQSAFRAIQGLSPEVQAEQVGRLASELTQQGKIEAAEHFLQASLDGSVKGVSLERYLPEIAHHLAQAKIQPAEFRSDWQLPLERLAPRLGQQGKLRVEALIGAFSGVSTDFPAPLPRPEAIQVSASLEAWTTTPDDRRVFSELLRTLGGLQSLKGDIEQGAAHQALAWRVDSKNGDAAVDLAASLQAKPQLDPDGMLLAELARQAPRSPEAVSIEGREPLLRLHALLGEIFFERKAVAPADQPGTALFHWLAAENFHRNQSVTDPSTEPIPILFENLGKAYVASGDWQRARTYYHEALSEYWMLGYPELATDLIVRIAEIERVATSSDDWLPRWIQLVGLPIERVIRTPQDLPVVETRVSEGSLKSQRELTILFDFDDSRLRPEALKTLAQIADLYKESSQEIEIWIEGHTDSTGSDRYNDSLGLERARAVWNGLRVLKVPAEKIWITSHGEDKLADEQKTDEAHARNRRVVLRPIDDTTPRFDARKRGTLQ